MYKAINEICTSVLQLGKSTTGQNMSALADQLDTFAGSCSPGCNAATQVCINIQHWIFYFYIVHVINVI